MASIVTANFDRNNVTPIRRERTEISVRPCRVCRRQCAWCVSGRRRSRRVARTEPSSSIAKAHLRHHCGKRRVAVLRPSPDCDCRGDQGDVAGPVLFFQYRYGYRNRRFKIYKFRTMRNDAGDVRGVRQTGAGRRPRDAGGANSAQDQPRRNSAAVQRDQGRHVAGRSSAACSGNAGGGLPYEDLVPYYFQRHTARPGITGLAQVSGCRGSTAQSGPAISRIDYDLHYIEEWSLRMDIAIIIRTIRKEFLSGSGF
jgi:hypothetical protein